MLVPDASLDVVNKAVAADVDRYAQRTTPEETAMTLATEITAVVDEHRPSADLIDNTLSMARLGTDALDIEPLHLEVVVNRSWETAASSAAILDIDGDPRTVHADESTLQQLFENLFANAVEHGSTSPLLQTQADIGSGASEPSVERGRPDSGGLVVRVGQLQDCFYVADNGSGLPAESRDEIFERGYSADDTGTGFGLAIVERIVDAYGGEITATDVKGGDARFKIRGLRVR